VESELKIHVKNLIYYKVLKVKHNMNKTVLFVLCCHWIFYHNL